MHICTVATLCFPEKTVPRNYYYCVQDDNSLCLCFKSMYRTLFVAIFTSTFIFSMSKSSHTYRNINISNQTVEVLIIIGFFVFTDWLFMFGCNGESWGGDHHFEEVCRYGAKKIRIYLFHQGAALIHKTPTLDISTLRRHLLPRSWLVVWGRAVYLGMASLVWLSLIMKSSRTECRIKSLFSSKVRSNDNP